MKKYLKNNIGVATILQVIFISPLVTWLIVFLLVGGSFLMEKNELKTIVNKTLDIALVEGQYKTDLQQSLKEELISLGFQEEYLEISITPTVSSDSNNSTYAKRGELIDVTVVYKKVHPIYYMINKTGDEENYYIRAKNNGMSEKW